MERPVGLVNAANTCVFCRSQRSDVRQVARAARHAARHWGFSTSRANRRVIEKLFENKRLHSWVTFADDAKVVAVPIFFHLPMTTDNLMLVNKSSSADPPSAPIARLAQAVLAWTSSPR